MPDRLQPEALDGVCGLLATRWWPAADLLGHEIDPVDLDVERLLQFHGSRSARGFAGQAEIVVAVA